MIDGTYKIDVDGPLGHKQGMVSMSTKGDVVYADIDMPIIGKQKTEGHVDGDTFTAEGVFKLGLLGKISYSLEGKVVGDDLSIAIDSSKGKFDLAGKRV